MMRNAGIYIDNQPIKHNHYKAHDHFHKHEQLLDHVQYHFKKTIAITMTIGMNKSSFLTTTIVKVVTKNLKMIMTIISTTILKI